MALTTALQVCNVEPVFRLHFRLVAITGGAFVKLARLIHNYLVAVGWTRYALVHPIRTLLTTFHS